MRARPHPLPIAEKSRRHQRYDGMPFTQDDLGPLFVRLPWSVEELDRAVALRRLLLEHKVGVIGPRQIIESGPVRQALGDIVHQLWEHPTLELESGGGDATIDELLEAAGPFGAVAACMTAASAARNMASFEAILQVEVDEIDRPRQPLA